MSNPGASFGDYGLVVLLSVIFGASFMLTKISLEDIPPTILVAGRFVGAFVVLAVVMKLAGQALPSPGPIWWTIIASAVFGNTLPFFLISWGQVGTDAGLAAILMAVMPLATIVLAHFYTQDEKLNRYRMAGFTLGIVGVVILIGYEKLAALGDETVRQLAILTAALCYAINAIITKGLVGLPQRAMATALMGVSMLIMVPVAILVDDPTTMTLSGRSLGAWILLILFPTAIGTLLLFAIVRRQGAAFLSQINFLVPVAGVGWGILILSEDIPIRAWLALAIILAGVAIARMKPNSTDETKSLLAEERSTK